MPIKILKYCISVFYKYYAFCRQYQIFSNDTFKYINLNFEHFYPLLLVFLNDEN